MKVAIMGAGVSGLTSAIILERNGIPFDIYEKRGEAGDRFVNGEIFLNLLTPVNDCITYLAESHNIYIKPESHINKIIITSPEKQAEIHGHFGHTIKRGRTSYSLEKQLEEQVKTPVRFHSTCSYKDLVQGYTHVILATGDADYAMDISEFQNDINVTLTGGMISGNFDPGTPMIWLDNNISPLSYAYIIPFSRDEAHMALGYPEYKSTTTYDSHALLSRFHDKAAKDLKQDLVMKDRFEVNHYKLGICQYPRIGNTFLTGNCFGSVMPFLGFGQFSSILTGIYAAQDIIGEGKYEELTKPLRKSYYRSLVLRRAWEQLDNKGYDRLTKIAGTRLFEKAINSKLNSAKVASMLAAPLVKTANLSRK
ncbi:NAD(P)/FAD-dependent oxidoreductase [Thalassorhabdus alkalitolerans]|uniref:NAD(P)/FAD-dependent oxidoreductase n=1 Tax=Thalassorhabdus alkalitolerans TaxID=2282697 RepID=A0ABW0YJX9_9BACI